MSFNRAIIGLAGGLSCCALVACSSATTQVVVPTVAQPAVAKPVQPPQPPTVSKGAESGKKQLLGSVASVQPDCTSDGYPVVTVTKKPGNGQFATENGPTYSSFPKDNVRFACNAQKVPGVLFYYTSNQGFTGLDSVALDILFPDGTVKKFSFAISVR